MKLLTKKTLFMLGVTITSLAYFSYFQNNSIETSEINIASEKVPPSFHQFKIVHLSDLHNKSFGKNQSVLSDKIQNIEPDLIVFTGDLVDKRNYNEEISLSLIEKIVQIAPVYYVTGNHEWASGKFDSLAESLEKLGVHVMRNSRAEIEIGEESIHILGVDDPLMYHKSVVEASSVEKAIQTLVKDMNSEENFKMLLAHRPEMFPLYSQYDIDLIFSGHAHGGQVRIPFLGGLIAPGQGFFPQYTSGKYEENASKMIVNRGLGNSIIPQRVFNRPEIIAVTLLSEVEEEEENR